MHRIDAAGYAAGNLFTDGNPSTGTPATVVDAAWLNDIQENLAQVIEAAGIVLAKGDYTQLLKAIVTKGMQGSYFNIGTAGGTADAITSSYSPAITALTNGMTLYVRAASANATTTPTFTPNSGTIAAKNIVKGNGLPLAAGDISGGGHWIELQYDATLDKWVLLNPATGINVAALSKNLFINAGCRVSQRGDAGLTYNLSTSRQIGQVDMVGVWASGGAVSAGTITHNTASIAGQTGHAARAAGVTLTGAGQISHSIRMRAADAAIFKNLTCCFRVQVSHDVGSNINYTLVVKKANSADNFGATTTIATSSAQAVPSGAGTAVIFNGVSMGDCSNGIELEVQAACGAVATKNFDVTEFQIEPGALVPFALPNYSLDYSACRAYAKVLKTGDSLGGGGFYTSTVFLGTINYDVAMRQAPSLTASGVTGYVDANGVSYTITGVSTQISGSNNFEFNVTTSSGSAAAGGCARMTGGTVVLSSDL